MDVDWPEGVAGFNDDNPVVIHRGTTQSDECFVVLTPSAHRPGSLLISTRDESGDYGAFEVRGHAEARVYARSLNAWADAAEREDNDRG